MLKQTQIFALGVYSTAKGQSPFKIQVTLATVQEARRRRESILNQGAYQLDNPHHPRVRVCVRVRVRVRATACDPSTRIS